MRKSLLKPIDHLQRKNKTDYKELKYMLEEFEKRYIPVGRRKGPPSRYDTSRMFNAIRPILVACLPQIAKYPKFGERMVYPVEALIHLLDAQSPFFYGEEYGSRVQRPLVKPVKAKKGRVLRDDPPDPNENPCGIDFSAYWDMTGD